MIVARPCEYTKNQWIVHFQRVNFMVCEFSLKNPRLKRKGSALFFRFSLLMGQNACMVMAGGQSEPHRWGQHPRNGEQVAGAWVPNTSQPSVVHSQTASWERNLPYSTVNRGLLQQSNLYSVHTWHSLVGMLKVIHDSIFPDDGQSYLFTRCTPHLWVSSLLQERRLQPPWLSCQFGKPLHSALRGWLWL